MERPEEKLLCAYRRIRAEMGSGPDWAVPKCNGSGERVIASIPFVGKEYLQQPCRMLVYASAEMLTGYTGYLDDDAEACDRHRLWFTRWQEQGEQDHFPHVHLGPMDNGGLAMAAAYCYEQLTGLSCGQHPAEFYGKIAFGNFSKFTIQPVNGKNIDGAGDQAVLSYSEPYAAQDLAVLQPTVILLPKTIAQTEQAFFRRYAANVLLLPVFQMLPRNINRLLNGYSTNGYERLSKDLQQWYNMLDHPKTGYAKNRITGKTKQNFRAVFDYLQQVMENSIITQLQHQSHKES